MSSKIILSLCLEIAVSDVFARKLIAWDANVNSSQLAISFLKAQQSIASAFDTETNCIVLFSSWVNDPHTNGKPNTKFIYFVQCIECGVHCAPNAETRNLHDSPVFLRRAPSIISEKKSQKSKLTAIFAYRELSPFPSSFLTFFIFCMRARSECLTNARNCIPNILEWFETLGECYVLFRTHVHRY